MLLKKSIILNIAHSVHGHQKLVKLNGVEFKGKFLVIENAKVS